MTTTFQHRVRVVALSVSLAIAGSGLQAIAAPFYQDHAQNQEQDYSKNPRYQQGMREGDSDRRQNKDHSKKRHFTKDEDQKAYEAGYQKSRQSH